MILNFNLINKILTNNQKKCKKYYTLTPAAISLIRKK
jgi:hypothetical protein